ncbi:MAG: polyprenyl synthetase family protein [Balneolales bacterium]|nr:polyprenyl synthetase family protein [Balneolales bacterium]
MSTNKNIFDDYFHSLSLPESPASLYEPISYILSIGGKKIRPKMVVAGCGLCGGNPKDALPAAAAVEMLHNFTLIHDDIMDNADKRRGLQTVHVKWNSSTAILSGDALFAQAFKQLLYYGADNRFSKDQYQALVSSFLNATQIVCEGQARDMDFESRQHVSIDEYLLMIEQKTAALLQSSFQMGAIIAGADEKSVEECGNIGLKAGIAFQIQDDLLDAIGDPEKFGKKCGGDIAEGKKTYLSILALQQASIDDKAVLQNVLASGATTSNEISDVIQLYHKYDVINQTKSEIDRLYGEAISSLMYFRESTFRDEINTLLNQLQNREN